MTTVTITGMTTAEDGGLAPAGLLRLMAWLSPAFPVGGFSYSHGLDYAVEAGLVTDRAQAEDWIGTILRHGSAWVDAGLFLAAHRAVRGDGDLAVVAERAAALRGSAEMALEATAQGRAFLGAVAAAWPDVPMARWRPALGAEPAYAVAVAVVAALAGIGETSALAAFLFAVAANLVSAAVRLVPLGQTDGQRIVARLTNEIPALVAAARVLSPDDLGGAAPMVDWTSMKHETQYTRLFRS